MMRVFAPQRGPLDCPTRSVNTLQKVPSTSSKRIALISPAAASNASNTSPAPPSSSSSASSTTEDYLSWAAAAGISFPKVTQAFFGDLRGSKALQPILPEEIFVTVPRTAALVVEPTGSCPCPDFVSPSFWKQAPWFIKMAVLLLKESSRGRDSPVWGYIVQLPESIDSPVRWTPAEVAELQYTPLETDILQQQKLWQDQYALFQKEAKGLGGANVSYERFVWAAENVRSRAFSGPYAGAPISDRLKILGFIAAAGLAYVSAAHVPLEQALNGAIAAAVFNLLYDVVLSSKLKWYALCPVVDAINHSSTVESTIEYEYFKDTFVVSTNCAYAPGDQVFISYGPQPNSALFQFYGFFEPGSKNDVYALPASFNNSSESVKLVVTANGNLSAESLKTAREAAGAVSDGEFRKLILEAMKRELAGKETTLADDERQLATAHLLTPRKKAALEFRAEKKGLLQKGIKRAKKRAETAVNSS